MWAGMGCRMEPTEDRRTKCHTGSRWDQKRHHGNLYKSGYCQSMHTPLLWNIIVAFSIYCVRVGARTDTHTLHWDIYAIVCHSSFCVHRSSFKLKPPEQILIQRCAGTGPGQLRKAGTLAVARKSKHAHHQLVEGHISESLRGASSKGPSLPATGAGSELVWFVDIPFGRRRGRQEEESSIRKTSQNLLRKLWRKKLPRSTP